MTHSSPNLESARIPTLDGWRGIAILLVLVTHAQKGLFDGTYGGHAWLNLGRHGVVLFFVLSGYLITSHLLAEDRIDLRRFYLRRFFRLMPVAWTYLAFIALIAWLSGFHIIGSDGWSCLFFFRNYFPAKETAHNAFTSHFWSLSIEEQFYLVWPALLRFAGRTRAFRIACVACALGAAYRFWNWQTYNQVNADTRTQVNFDALLVGCILALALRSGPLRGWLVRYHAFLVPICLASMAWHIAYYHQLIPLTESVSIAVLIGSTSLTPASPFSRLLDRKLLQSLGIYSYSLYMWQEFFLLPHWGIIGPALLPIMAVMSWNFIEQPGLRLGKRISGRIAVPSTAPAQETH